MMRCVALLPLCNGVTLLGIYVTLVLFCPILLLTCITVAMFIMVVPDVEAVVWMLRRSCDLNMTSSLVSMENKQKTVSQCNSRDC